MSMRKDTTLRFTTIPFSLLILISMCLLGACSPSRRPLHLLTGEYLDSPTQMRNKDIGIEQKADALHAFLVGEIALDKGNTTEGLAALKRASGLVEKTVPEISRQVAELHLARREIDSALEAYQELQLVVPKDSSVLIPLAGLFELKGDYDRALSNYESVSPSDARAMEAQLLRSVILDKTMGKGARSKALETITKRYSKEMLPYLLLGLSYEDEGNLKAAERALLKAVKNDERRVATLVELMRIQVQELELDDAVKTARDILKHEPENLLARRVISAQASGALQLESKSFHLPPRHSTDTIGTRLLIALTAIENNKFNLAAEHLSLLTAADPSDMQVRVFLSTVFSALGKRKEALQELDAVPPSAKNYTRARMLAAFISKAEGDVTAAEKAARQALKVTPDDMSARSFLIELLKEQGNFNDAITLVRDTLETRSQDPKLLFLLATLLHDSGEHKEALKVIEQVLALDPENENSLNYAAYALAEGGRDLTRAKEYIERALKQEPTNGYFLDTLGWISYQEERYEEALASFTKALKTVPLDAVILLHTARTYEKLGRYQAEASLLSKCIEELDEVLLHDEEQQAAYRELKALQRSLRHGHPEYFAPRYPLPAQE